MQDMPGGIDLASEVAWLEKIARHFQGSPIVLDVLARLRREDIVSPLQPERSSR